jgi:DNA polymerase III subunit epsilon
VEDVGLPSRFAVVDVETSGLSARRHRILQIAVVTVSDDGAIVERWSSYVRPGFGWVGARRVHGLTRRVLRSAPPFAAVAADVAGRLDGAILVAHNAAFDWAFIHRALRRARVDAADTQRLCTMRLSRSLDPDGVLSHRLADVAGRHGIALEHAHDALADAEATARLLPRLLAAAGADPADAASLRPFVTDSGPAPGVPRRARGRRLLAGRAPRRPRRDARGAVPTTGRRPRTTPR